MIKKNIATNEMGFVFNPASGDSFTSNPIAAQTIQFLKEGKSISEIKKLLLEKYEVEKATLEKDIDEFINTLSENNLLQK